MENNQNNEEQIPEENEKTQPGVSPSCEQQLESLKKDMLYMRAEFENTRKRQIRDQDQALKFANERIIRELLQVVDLFDRGMGAAATLKAKTTDNKELDSFVNGIDLTHRELVNCLQRFGVEFIGTAGEPFSPEKHEAVSMQESNSDGPEVVLEVLARGASLQGRLIQPAKVVVGKK